MLALGIDYVGGALRGNGRRLSPGHFAERYGLIVIIALGTVVDGPCLLAAVAAVCAGLVIYEGRGRPSRLEAEAT